MLSVVSSNPAGANFILFLKLFKTLDVNYVQKCQICVEKEKPGCVDNQCINVPNKQNESLFSKRVMTYDA